MTCTNQPIMNSKWAFLFVLFLIPAQLHAQGLHQRKADSLAIRVHQFRDSLLLADSTNSIKLIHHGTNEHEIVINLQWNVNDNIDHIDRFQRVVAVRILNEVIKQRNGSYDLLVRYKLRKHILSSCTSYIVDGIIKNAQCHYIRNSEYYSLTNNK